MASQRLFWSILIAVEKEGTFFRKTILTYIIARAKNVGVTMNYPAAEQRGILKNIERPKGRGLVCLRQDQTLVRLYLCQMALKKFLLT